MTYPESEIRRVLKEQRYSSISDDELIKAMKSCSDSDRERIRMELWKECYVRYTGSNHIDALCTMALEAFDKQFPNQCQ